MSVLGGTKAVRSFAALLVGLLLAGGVTACAYEDDGDPQPTADRYSPRPAPSLPSARPEILGVQAANHAELEKRLGVARGSVLLNESGPADGPGVGFSKTATVKTVWRVYRDGRLRRYSRTHK